MPAGQRSAVGSIPDTGIDSIAGKTYINMTAATPSRLVCHLGLEGPPGYKEQPRGSLVAWSRVMVQLLQIFKKQLVREFKRRAGYIFFGEK